MNCATCTSWSATPVDLDVHVVGLGLVIGAERCGPRGRRAFGLEAARRRGGARRPSRGLHRAVQQRHARRQRVGELRQDVAPRDLLDQRRRPARRAARSAAAWLCICLTFSICWRRRCTAGPPRRTASRRPRITSRCTMNADRRSPRITITRQHAAQDVRPAAGLAVEVVVGKEAQLVRTAHGITSRFRAARPRLSRLVRLTLGVARPSDYFVLALRRRRFSRDRAHAQADRDRPAGLAAGGGRCRSRCRRRCRGPSAPAGRRPAPPAHIAGDLWHSVAVPRLAADEHQPVDGQAREGRLVVAAAERQLFDELRQRLRRHCVHLTLVLQRPRRRRMAAGVGRHRLRLGGRAAAVAVRATPASCGRRRAQQRERLLQRLRLGDCACRGGRDLPPWLAARAGLCLQPAQLDPQHPRVVQA